MVLWSAFEMKWKTIIFTATGKFQLAIVLLENGAVVSIQDEMEESSPYCPGGISVGNGFA